MADVILFLVCSIAATLLYLTMKSESLYRAIAVALGGIGLTILIFGMAVETRTGTRRVVTQFEGITGRVLEPGLGFILPWQATFPMSTEYQAWGAEGETSYLIKTADSQELKVSITVVYQRDPEKLVEIANQVGMDSELQHIEPAARNAVNGIFTKFKAPDIFPERKKIADQLNDSISSDISEKGLNAIFVAINDIEFVSDEYRFRNEAKQIKVEEGLEAKYTLMIAAIEAQRQEADGAARGLAMSETARGEAEAKRLVSDAEAYGSEIVGVAEAEKLQLQGQVEAYELTQLSIASNENVLRHMAAKAWNGVAPDSHIGADNSLPFFKLMRTEEVKARDGELTTPDPITISDIETRLLETQKRLAEEVKIDLDVLKTPSLEIDDELELEDTQTAPSVPDAAE